MGAPPAFDVDPLEALALAKWYARLAAERTRYAFFFILVVFFILPLLVIGLSRWLS